MNTKPHARWNYRVMRRTDGNLELVEVYYDADGTGIIDVVRQPLFSAFIPGGEDVHTIISNLRNAHRDPRDKPLIDEAQLVSDGLKLQGD